MTLWTGQNIEGLVDSGGQGIDFELRIRSMVIHSQPLCVCVCICICICISSLIFICICLYSEKKRVRSGREMDVELVIRSVVIHGQRGGNVCLPHRLIYIGEYTYTNPGKFSFFSWGQE